MAEVPTAALELYDKPHTGGNVLTICGTRKQLVPREAPSAVRLCSPPVAGPERQGGPGHSAASSHGIRLKAGPGLSEYQGCSVGRP